MPFFQRNFYTPAPADQTFTNLFRLLDDFDTYTRENSNPTGAVAQPQAKGAKGGRSTSAILGRPFNPRFDVRETEQTYELHGELAGVDRKDVSIEFTEPQTLVVSGHIERNYTSGTPPAEGEEFTHVETPRAPSPSHHATVSDEAEENAKERGESVTDKAQQVAAPAAKEVAPAAQPVERFWVQERAVGQFHRTFSFPQAVDEANVKASLDNGILNISIPKLKRESRRISLL